MNLLRYGTSPEGKQVTKAGVKFALTEHRGDWSFFKQLLGFASSWIGGTHCSVCFRCDAYGTGQGNYQYWNVGQGAHCWSQEYDRVTFIARQMPTRQICFSECQLFCLLHFWRLGRLIDWLLVHQKPIASGPIINLWNFHPALFKFCSMHVLNLGICFQTCGSSLLLGCADRTRASLGGNFLS